MKLLLIMPSRMAKQCCTYQCLLSVLTRPEYVTYILQLDKQELSQA